MFWKLLVSFLSAVILQIASAQILGSSDRLPSGACLPWTSVTQLLGPVPSGGTFGGSFPVTSTCPTSPRGLAIKSENYYDGILRVIGEIPFLSTISVEGAVPSVGAGIITYGCGTGDVTMLSEDIEPLGTPAYGYGPVLAGLNACPERTALL